MKMFTNRAGKQRCDEGLCFWAWSVKPFEENHHEIMVNEGDYEVEDDGLYIIKNINNVIWNTKDDEEVEKDKFNKQDEIPSYDSMTEEQKKIIDEWNSIGTAPWIIKK